MFIKIAKVAVAGLGLLFIVAAAEYQVFAYAASYLRHEIGGAERNDATGETPQEVLLRSVGENDERLNLLAVGDIASCARTDAFGRILPALSDQMGLHKPMVTSHADPAASARLAMRWPDEAILAIGDLVYQRGTPGEFADCYDMAWGGLRSRTLPAPGNHEYGTPGAFGYFDYWGKQAGPARQGYYAMRWKNWLILSLNSEVDAGPGSAQSEWLAGELGKAPDACVMAVFHKPAFSSVQRKHGMADAAYLFAQVQRAGGSLVINGHNHLYERTLPLTAEGKVDPLKGMIAFTAGTGGIEGAADHDAELPSHIARAVFGKIGLLRLELTDQSYAWWFHEADSGTVLDAGAAPCRKRGERL